MKKTMRAFRKFVSGQSFGFADRVAIRRGLLVVSLGTVLLFFQNCGQSGFDSVQDGSITGSSVNSKFLKAPLPVDLNFNQVAFMSCPAVIKNPVDADPLNNPFFTLRGGGFDNSDLNSFSGPAGGLGISKEALGYVRSSISSAAAPQSISYFVRSSPFTNNKYPTVGVLSRARSAEKPSNIMISQPFFDVLNNNYVGLTLGSAAANPAGGLNKVSFFPQAQFGKRAFVTNLNAKTADDIVRMYDGSELNGNSYFVLGLVDSENASAPERALVNFASPDQDSAKRIFGKGYTFRFSNRGRMSPDECSFQVTINNGNNETVTRNTPCLRDNSGSTSSINAVTEYDLNPQSTSANAGMDPIDITARDGQAWGCLNFMIVRHVDRFYFRSKVAFTDRPVQPGSSIKFSARVGDILPKQYAPVSGEFEQVFFNSESEVSNIESLISGGSSATYGSSTALFQPGRFAACPPSNVEDLDSPDQRDLLRIARRFLPAEQWEINLKQRCVVPLRRTETSGSSCYAVGDDKSNLYVRYRLSSSFGCSPTGDECPAFVNICYRRK